ncbi:hypothetical protein QSJ18_06350 [Gordonia sp. ABSL1-1]|uniref:hypothetical protein n=1 Tax=Gordonia sp. ABSL1-1 TaxID=3053923 RepID=UPI00257430DD|nr:hypothetical protein [Gordonia sp. ABSL1-1]MDL9936359.1 hypothetical protein [Gordonia sp. ABSL1-1]
MLAAVVFVPSAPLLVPALAGPAAEDTEPVRSAAVSALTEAVVGAGVRAWVAVGAADKAAIGRMPDGPSRGSFARYGVDVPVAFASGVDPVQVDDAGEMSLSMLIAAWFRAQAGLDRLCPLIVGPQTPPEECMRIGALLGADIEATDEPVGVLVVGDGATALSARAPGGGLRESAVAVQARIDHALATADLAAVGTLTATECEVDGVGGRAAWQVAAGLCNGQDLLARSIYADAPFGVGYTVARWSPR